MFAAPMVGLYLLSIAIAAIFGKVQPMVFGETTARRLPHPPALLPILAGGQLVGLDQLEDLPPPRLRQRLDGRLHGA